MWYGVLRVVCVYDIRFACTSGGVCACGVCAHGGAACVMVCVGVCGVVSVCGGCIVACVCWCVHAMRMVGTV